MVLQLTTWTLGGISFNTRLRDADGILWYITEDSSPLMTPAPLSQYSPIQGRHGVFRIPGYKDRNRMSFTIRAHAQHGDEAARIRAELKVLALCQDPNTLYDLYAYTPAGAFQQRVALDGDILIKPVPSHEPGFEASIALTAPDPRRYSADYITQEVGLPQISTTGLDFKQVNLAVNPSFESGITGWTSINATLTVDTTQFSQGLQSLKVTATSTAAATGAVSTANITGLTAAKTYTFSADVKTQSTATVVMEVNWKNAGGSAISTTTQTFASIATGAWVPIKGQHVAPALATQATIQIRQTTTPIATYVSFDNLFFYDNQTGLDFDTTGGLHFGVGLLSSGALTLTNAGTAPSPVAITLFGPLTTPTITTDTGAIMTYNGTLSATDFVVINPESTYVSLNSTTNRSYLVYPANFQDFVIQPGSTLRVSLSHLGASSDAGYLRTSYRPAWW